MLGCLFDKMNEVWVFLTGDTDMIMAINIIDTLYSLLDLQKWFWFESRSVHIHIQ